MNIVVPQNIYSAIFAMLLPDELKDNVKVTASSLIANEIEKGVSDIGLMPSFDILNHNELFVSKKVGLSFDGQLSNTYFYFVPGSEKIHEIFLRGDVSSNEIILSKILFSERFDSNIKLTLDTSEITDDNKNYIIAGSDNFGSFDINKGISFSDQVAEMLDYPYVNFIWVSKSEDTINEFNSLFNEIDKKVEDKIGVILSSLNLRNEVNEFIESNLNTVYFEMTDNEIAGLHELIKLSFYHGILKEMFELKLV